LTEQDWGKPLLTQLPWEDVLFASILPHLEPDDWLALSCTCKAFNKMVKEFTKQNKRLVFQPESGSAQIFQQLTRHSVSLRVAGFPFCTWLTDELLQPVVENNLLLERLDISGCNSLTDTLLLRVSVCLTRLTHLNLSHCLWVSGASIDFLAFHHRNFTGLEALREIVVCRNFIGLEARFTGMFPALDRWHVGRAVR